MIGANVSFSHETQSLRHERQRSSIVLDNREQVNFRTLAFEDVQGCCANVKSRLRGDGGSSLLHYNKKLPWLTFSPNRLRHNAFPDPAATGAIGVLRAFRGYRCCANPFRTS